MSFSKYHRYLIHHCLVDLRLRSHSSQPVRLGKADNASGFVRIIPPVPNVAGLDVAGYDCWKRCTAKARLLQAIGPDRRRPCQGGRVLRSRFAAGGLTGPQRPGAGLVMQARVREASRFRQLLDGRWLGSLNPPSADGVSVPCICR